MGFKGKNHVITLNFMGYILWLVSSVAGWEIPNSPWRFIAGKSLDPTWISSKPRSWLPEGMDVKHIKSGWWWLEPWFSMG